MSLRRSPEKFGVVEGDLLLRRLVQAHLHTPEA
jgi:hypothetical protein